MKLKKWGKMSWGKMSSGEKCRTSANFEKNGEKCRLGKNVAGKNVMGKNVIWGKMSCTR